MHKSVLLEEAIQYLNLKEDAIIVDCTLGYGGHSSEILKRIPKGHLYAFDQDEEAIQSARKRLSEISSNFTIVKSNFVHLKEKLQDDKSKETYHAYQYLYHFLQSMDTTKELKYILAYMSKSLGFTDPNEYVFNESQQFIFESIQFSAMTLYASGGASKSRIAETHKRFVREIEHKKEEKLSRTQELNTAKVQALKELGYTTITEDNAKEVLDKIAEIQSRKIA